MIKLCSKINCGLGPYSLINFPFHLWEDISIGTPNWRLYPSVLHKHWVIASF